MNTNCPFCSAALPSSDLEAGWCDACGKKLPAGMMPRHALRPSADGPTTVSFGQLVGGLLLGLLGVLLFAGAMHGEFSDKMYRTKFGSTYMKSGATQRFEMCAGGLFVLGLGVFLAATCVKPKAPERDAFPGRNLSPWLGDANAAGYQGTTAVCPPPLKGGWR